METKPIDSRRVGRWAVSEQYITTAKGEKKYLCLCDCGTERYVLERSLKSGGSLSCGCLRRERAQQATAYDLLGKTFGELKVVGKSRKRTKMGAYWTCLCSCGYTCEATASELVSGRKTNCGCKNVKNYASSDITGQRFGRLTAQYSTKKRDTKGFVIWHCRCDCGNETVIKTNPWTCRFCKLPNMGTLNCSHCGKPVSDESMLKTAKDVAKAQLMLDKLDPQGNSAPMQQSVPQSWNCSYCGAQNSGNFCESCGAKRP